MDVTPGKIEFDHLGIGTVLQRSRLTVPFNQREYAWKKDNVQDLFQDLSDAINSGNQAYFLGTIVLVGGKSAASHQVTDGQQRLATTTILMAAIRDYLSTRQDASYVQQAVERFLFDIDRDRNQLVPRLTLNVEDNEFFRQRILSSPRDPGRLVPPTKPSHEKIALAAKEAESHVHAILSDLKEQRHVNELNKWIGFIEKSAQLIILYVADDINAFVMFETLNDRGVKTTQADMLKNFLFGEAKERAPEASMRWSSMKGALETGDTDDVVVTFLRHFLVVRHGATRDKEVYGKIKSVIRGPDSAIGFLENLSEQATAYAALANHQHQYWSSYGVETAKIRRHIETLNELNVEQIRPLMLACIERFSQKDIATAFRLFISWAVRFMVGGSPTGTVEKYYAGRAVEVWKDEVKTAAELASAMNKYLPSDDSFRTSFSQFKVSKSYLARYYLRCLERALKDDPQPEWIVNDDPSELTLEHILPENPGAGWGHIDQPTAESVYRRLGNMVLLKMTPNTKIGNASFDVKKQTYHAVATLELTRQVLSCPKWGLAEIESRQERLADLAVKAWPLVVK